MEQSTKAYEPGTVAVATVRGAKGVRVVRHDGWWYNPGGPRQIAEDGDVTDVRPLVVLDAPQVDLLTAANHLRSDGWGSLADQIEAQVKPPRIPEPNGIGAVIEDARGDHWVRLGYGPAAWIFAASSPGNRDTYSYSSIDAVRVLAEGVSR